MLLGKCINGISLCLDLALLVLGLALFPMFVLGNEYAIVTASMVCCMVAMAYHVASS